MWVIVGIAACAACSSPEAVESDSLVTLDSPSTSDSRPQASEEILEIQPLPENDASNFVVLKLDIGDQRTFTFYERAPGFMLMGESTDPGVPAEKSVFRRAGSLNPLEVYDYLRPGESVPPALQAAWQRAEAAASALEAQTGHQAPTFDSGGGAPQLQPLPSVVRSSDGVGSIQQAHSSSSASHFINSHDDSCDVWFPVLQQTCRINWANGFWDQGNAGSAQLSSFGKLDHYSGNGVLFRLTTSEGVTDFSTPVGTRHSITAFCPGFCRWDVLNASNDSFHVSTTFMKPAC